MEEKPITIPGPRELIAALRPRDYLHAIGPLLVATVFAYVLYAIQVPVNFIVLFGVGLIYWPAYEFMGMLLERGLVAAFLSAAPETWQRFRNGFFPILFMLVIIGLFYFGQWFWLIIAAQLIPLIYNPPDEHQQREGCFHTAVTAALLFIVVILSLFQVPTMLSELFHFPNVRGGLQFLPGMLIIGIGYYLLMAIIVVLQQPFLRRPVKLEQTPTP